MLRHGSTAVRHGKKDHRTDGEEFTLPVLVRLDWFSKWNASAGLDAAEWCRNHTVIGGRPYEPISSARSVLPGTEAGITTLNCRHRCYHPSSR